MPYHTPEIVHTIDGIKLRQFSINGTIWFPIYDICRLLETSRNPTQVAKSLSADFLIRIKMSDRPPTNMISIEGLFGLISRSPRVEDAKTRAYAFSQWCENNLRQNQSREADSVSREITLLQGTIEFMTSSLQKSNERLENLIVELDTIRSTKAERGQP